MKKLLLSIILFGATFSVIGQELTQTIRGVITDKDSKTPIPGATIILLDLEPITGTTSDLDGKFRLEDVKVGRAGVQISFIGYSPVTLNNLSLSSGKEYILNVELVESVVKAKEVEIIAYREKAKTINRMASVSARTFSVEESQRYAGSMNDVSRMASNFAGVQSSNDQRNDIIIRGNAPTGVLYRLEGIDIPSPNHFSTFGTTGGPISILNNNVLSNSDFMTGAFPAEYGNALAGVFDLKMRNGNNEQHEFLGMMGFNGAELMAEGPISKNKRASYLINYRYSTLDLFKYLGIDFGTSAVPHYQDMSFKLNFPRKKGTTQFFGLGGHSNIDLLDSEIDPDTDLYADAGEDVYFSSNVAAAGLSHTYLVNNSTYLKFLYAGNIATQRIATDSLSTLDQSPFNVYRNSSNYLKQSLNTFINKKFNAHHIVKAGFIADRLTFDMTDSVYYSPYNTYVKLSNFKGSTYLIRPYAQWQYRITDQLIINSGIYAQHFVLNGSRSIEPRMGAKWQINNLNSINFGYGLHSQMQPVQVYFAEETDRNGNTYNPTENTDFTKSHHLIIGYDRQLAENLRIKSEAYYQSIFNAPVSVYPGSYSMLNQGADFTIGFPDSLVNTGTGTNFGVELTVEHFLAKGLYFLVTGSLFESKYKGSDKIERNTAFNGNYALTALAGKDFTLGGGADKAKHSVLFFDLRFKLQGGQRYISIDLEASNAVHKTVYDLTSIYDHQYPDYMRMDMNIGFRLNGKKVTQEWIFNLQNFTNQKNIFIQEYNKISETIDTSYQLGFLPIFQYKIQF